MSNQLQGLTPEEKQVLDTLGEAYNLFAALPVLHPWDAHEFTHAIHAAQNIVPARVAMRHMAQPAPTPLVASEKAG